MWAPLRWLGLILSPLKRAYRTIEPLATKTKSNCMFRDLMERGFGIVEGLEIGNITSAKATHKT